MSNISKFIDAIRSNDEVAIKESLKKAIVSKVNTVLDIKRVAITSDIYNKVNESVEDLSEAKVTTMSFGQSISYKAPHPERTLTKASGNGTSFIEYKTEEEAKEALLKDGAKPPGKKQGLRPLHDRHK